MEGQKRGEKSPWMGDRYLR